MLSTRILLRMLPTRSIAVREAMTTTSVPPPPPTDVPPSKSEERREEIKEERKTEAKLVVFGGNGFVGSRVCEEGLRMGLHVVSINRSGFIYPVLYNHLATATFNAFSFRTYTQSLIVLYKHPWTMIALPFFVNIGQVSQCFDCDVLLTLFADSDDFGVDQGRPSWLKAPWANSVEWIYGDALQPASYADHLKDALCAISCVGGFGSNAAMYRICGTANINIIETAASVDVPRFVFVSVYHDTLPSLVKQIGYFKGKIDAETALMQRFGTNGVSLRPFFIHGMRHLTESLGIPLQFVGMPLERALNWIPNNKQLATSIPILGTGLIPPVKVQSVAKAAVAAATDPSMQKTVLDVWDIAKY